MATFGICGALDFAPPARESGWDYVEGSVQTLFQGLVPDGEWKGEQAIRSSPLPVPAANMFMPGDVKVVGPNVDDARVSTYVTRALARAGACGTRTIVFGSAGARNLPEGFSRDEARKQIEKFLRTCAPLAERAGVTIVIEPLNRGESNIINSVSEGMEYVRAVNHPNIRCLVDSYHFWLEREPLASLAAAMPWIAHVHVADELNRDAPGTSGANDYRAFFKVLKDGGYDGRISVESPKLAPDRFASTLAFLKREWNAVA